MFASVVCVYFANETRWYTNQEICTVDSMCCLDNEKYLYSANVGAGTFTILFLMQL